MVRDNDDLEDKRKEVDASGEEEGEEQIWQPVHQMKILCNHQMTNQERRNYHYIKEYLSRNFDEQLKKLNFNPWMKCGSEALGRGYFWNFVCDDTTVLLVAHIPAPNPAFLSGLIKRNVYKAIRIRKIMFTQQIGINGKCFQQIWIYAIMFSQQSRKVG